LAHVHIEQETFIRFCLLKAKYERECHRRESLQKKLLELEKELQNRQCQSILLGQLQTDVERLHIAFNALEAENNQLTAQLSLVQNSCPSSVRLSSQLEKFRHELAQTCHESLC
ncbi:unnamed protein product, partial [Adineta ricciae]